MALYPQKAACLFRIKHFISGIVFIALIACNDKSAADKTLPFYDTKDLTAHWISESSDSFNRIHTIAPFAFTDQQNRLFTADSLIGKVYIASFFFTTCPDICPKMTNNLSLVQDSFLLNSTVKIVSFTVMPWVDSAARLADYGKQKHINPNKWHLLTGEQSAIYQLGRASFFADDNPAGDTSSFLHTDKMFLVDRHRRIRGVYNATRKDDVQRAIDDIRILTEQKTD